MSLLTLDHRQQPNMQNWIILGTLAVFHLAGCVLAAVLTFFPKYQLVTQASSGTVVMTIPRPVTVYLLCGCLGLLIALILELLSPTKA